MSRELSNLYTKEELEILQKRVQRLENAVQQAWWEFNRLGRNNFALLMKEALEGHPGGTENIGKPEVKE